MAQQKPSPRTSSIEVEVEGRRFGGHYVVDRGVITVTTAFQSKSAQLGNSSPEHLARVLLHELAAAAKKAGPPLW